MKLPFLQAQGEMKKSFYKNFILVSHLSEKMSTTEYTPVLLPTFQCSMPHFSLKQKNVSLEFLICHNYHFPYPPPMFPDEFGVLCLTMIYFPC